MELMRLVVGDDAATWAALGFAMDGDRCRVGAVTVVCDPSVGKGVRRWVLSGQGDHDGPGPDTVDGLPTEWDEGFADAADAADAARPAHPNGVTAIDHVVLASPDVDRTIAALGALGLAPRRERVTDTYGAPMRQVFFRLGQPILELVGPAEPAGDAAPRFFGLAFTSDDLARTGDVLHGRLHPPKAAVQPGRFIATLDKAAGSTVPIAFMSPEVDTND